MRLGIVIVTFKTSKREAINSQEPDVKKAEAELIKGMNSVIEEEKIDAVEEDEEKDQ